MQINGSSVNSINFLEQKKSITPSSNETKDTLQEPIDTFVGKSVPSTNLLETNESIGILQTAHNSITKLKDNNEELQKLTEKYEYFKSQEEELNSRFEDITVKMLDIVDNTLFKDTQLFYGTHTFNSGNSEFNLSLMNDYGIEDFSIEDTDKLNNFGSKLETIETKISTIKQNIEVANFNQMAALHVKSPLIHIEANDLSNKSEKESVELSKEDIKEAHDISSLKDKVSLLLED